MKTESKDGLGIFLGGVASLLLALIAGWLIFSQLRDAWLLSEGKGQVAKVEAYRLAHGKLPESLGDIGKPDGGAWYYVQREGGCYELGYSRGLGSSTFYDSRDQRWKEVD